jgi:hypothetical protein
MDHAASDACASVHRFLHFLENRPKSRARAPAAVLVPMRCRDRKKNVGALADHLGAMLTYLGWLNPARAFITEGNKDLPVSSHLTVSTVTLFQIFANRLIRFQSHDKLSFETQGTREGLWRAGH